MRARGALLRVFSAGIYIGQAAPLNLLINAGRASVIACYLVAPDYAARANTARSSFSFSCHYYVRQMWDMKYSRSLEGDCEFLFLFCVAFVVGQCSFMLFNGF